MNQTETEDTENTGEYGLINARCKQKYMWCPPTWGSISAIDRYEIDRYAFHDSRFLNYFTRHGLKVNAIVFIRFPALKRGGKNA